MARAQLIDAQIEEHAPSKPGRKALAPAEQRGPAFVGATPADMAAQEASARGALQLVEAKAAALAQELGYVGALTVGTLEDEIRFYQRRTVEAILETGKRLLLLKEVTPHGEFTSAWRCSASLIAPRGASCSQRPRPPNRPIWPLWPVR